MAGAWYAWLLFDWNTPLEQLYSSITAHRTVNIFRGKRISRLFNTLIWLYYFNVAGGGLLP
jgi:hypothetical protein